MKWVVRIVQGILALGFIMAGMSKFFMGTAELERLYTEPLGYSVEFLYVIGVIEVVGALCLIAGFWRARFTAVGSLSIGVVMAGASISVLLSDQSFVTAISPLAMLIAAAFITLRSVNAWFPGKTKVIVQ